ncbi:MAG: DUF6320 domain-containing protein [Bacilli bacterium]|jgi:hypothetical protein|nr:DUF6320 domain-containing protein [Bacilli bacterium]
MDFCPDCKVNIVSKGEKCPLCHGPVEHGDEPASKKPFPSYIKFINLRKRWARGISIAAPVAIGVCVLINLLTWNGFLWSLIVGVAILYAWLVGLYTVRRTDHLGQKLLLHAIGLSALLIVINFVTASPSMTSSLFLENFSEIAKWSLDYAMPATLMLFILAINIAMLSQRHRLHDYVIAQFSLSFIGFIPFVLILIDIFGPDILGSLFMSIAASSFSFLTLLFFVIFAPKLVAKEFGRRFHI